MLLFAHAVDRHLRLAELADLTWVELQQAVPGVRCEDYRRLMAAVELGPRVAEAMLNRNFRQDAIRSSASAREFCERHFRRLATDRLQEEYFAVSMPEATKYAST